ncbi:hypothetical protein AN958_10823 [Leucoagaricus sp. SymC.cos]|nr:hypothetical protein AN958_10823 [Leucoagaricus sp. SymC.cos]
MESNNEDYFSHFELNKNFLSILEQLDPSMITANDVPPNNHVGTMGGQTVMAVEDAIEDAIANAMEGEWPGPLKSHASQSTTLLNVTSAASSSSTSTVPQTVAAVAATQEPTCRKLGQPCGTGYRQKERAWLEAEGTLPQPLLKRGPGQPQKQAPMNSDNVSIEFGSFTPSGAGNDMMAKSHLVPKCPVNLTVIQPPPALCATEFRMVPSLTTIQGCQDSPAVSNNAMGLEVLSLSASLEEEDQYVGLSEDGIGFEGGDGDNDVDSNLVNGSGGRWNACYIGLLASTNKIPHQLLLLLTNPNVIKVGCMVKQDLAFLQSTSHLSNDQWENEVLSQSQVDYAAHDAYISLVLYDTLMKIPTPSPLPPNPQLGLSVNIHHSNNGRLIVFGYVIEPPASNKVNGVCIFKTRIAIRIMKVIVPGAMLGAHKVSLESFGPPPFTAVVLCSHL